MQEIIHIKDVNMLGRKLLSENNPLLGINLDKRSTMQDNNARYMKERWFIEEIINDDSIPSGDLLTKFNEDLRERLNSNLNFHLSWDSSNLDSLTPGITSGFTIISEYYVILTGKTLQIVNKIDTDMNVILRTGI
jgi:hypothetical protein